MQRRDFLTAALLPFGMPATALAGGFFGQAPSADPSRSPINVFVPFNYRPDLGEAALSAIHGATLQFLADSFPSANLPLWKRPLADIDMGFRLQVTLDNIARGVAAQYETFPIDPVWVLAQILAESWLYDGAISNASAVGLCQITTVAARENGLLIAADLPEHKAPPYAKPELAGALARIEEAQKERARFVKAEKPKQEITLDEALTAIAELRSDTLAERARTQILYRSRLTELDDYIKSLRAEYKTYLEANYLENGGGHPAQHAAFFEQFDHRFLQSKAVPAMVAILCKNLRKRNGNILAAAAAYNAGLSTTLFDERLYSGFGRIPAFEETTRYLSRIIGNYFEIRRRLAEG